MIILHSWAKRRTRRRVRDRPPGDDDDESFLSLVILASATYRFFKHIENRAVAKLVLKDRVRPHARPEGTVYRIIPEDPIVAPSFSDLQLNSTGLSVNVLAGGRREVPTCGFPMRSTLRQSVVLDNQPPSALLLPFLEAAQQQMVPSPPPSVNYSPLCPSPTRQPTHPFPIDRCEHSACRRDHLK